MAAASQNKNHRMEFLSCGDPYENPANRPFMEQFVHLTYMTDSISIDYHEKLNEYVVYFIDGPFSGRFFKCLDYVTIGGLIDQFYGTYTEELAVRHVSGHRGSPEAAGIAILNKPFGELLRDHEMVQISVTL